MPEYLVGNSDESLLSVDLRLVTADSQTDAIDTYIRKYIVSDPEFLQSISDKSINSSFMERFVLVGKDFNKFMETGSLILDRTKIERRVRHFFSDKESYADLYLNYYFSEESQPDEVKDFPKEMLEWIYLASRHMAIEAIALKEIRRL